MKYCVLSEKLLHAVRYENRCYLSSWAYLRQASDILRNHSSRVKICFILDCNCFDCSPLVTRVTNSLYG